MEETKVQDDSKQEAAGLSAQDQARKRKKAAKASVLLGNIKTYRTLHTV